MQQPVHQQPAPQPGQVKNRRKKKTAVPQGQPAPPGGQQPPPMGQVVPPLRQLVPGTVGQQAPMVNSVAPLATVQPMVPDTVAPVAKQKKAGRCWKCAVNTHATKDSLVQVSWEGAISAADVQSLMARMCPGNPAWRWEAVPHGANAFLIGIPTADDLSRIDGMQMSVPKTVSVVPPTSGEQQPVASSLHAQLTVGSPRAPGSTEERSAPLTHRAEPQPTTAPPLQPVGGPALPVQQGATTLSSPGQAVSEAATQGGRVEVLPESSPPLTRPSVAVVEEMRDLEQRTPRTTPTTAVRSSESAVPPASSSPSSAPPSTSTPPAKAGEIQGASSPATPVSAAPTSPAGSPPRSPTSSPASLQ
nr:uncharacterized protein LOC127329059 [Lolium perenne]